MRVVIVGYGVQGRKRRRVAADEVVAVVDPVAPAPDFPNKDEGGMTLLAWHNHFTCDVLAEGGTAHIESLCKWGPTTFTQRTRILPSGRPPEETVTLVEDDPTWELEYRHFKDLCARRTPTSLDNDVG